MKAYLGKTLFAFCLLLLSGLPAHAFLGELLHLPPHAGYKTLETKRFSIIYPKEYEEEAKRSLQYFEEAHRKLADRFHYNRDDQVTVILSDTEDLANGVTSAVGLQGMVLFLKAPEPYFSIGEYDDWLRTLVFHEYTHYLTLAQTRGVFSVFRVLFGHSLLPNHAWPSWLAEGLAVWVESHYTRQGRGRGTLYNTITRDALAKGLLGSEDYLGFDLILTNPRPEYPFGESAYYTGYGIVDELVRRSGPKSLGTLVKEGSYRVPYFLNGTLENVVEAHPSNESRFRWRDLWMAWVERERNRLQPELDWLKRRDSSPSIVYHSPEGDSAVGARLSPDGKLLAFTKQSGHHEFTLFLKNLETGETKEVIKGLSTPGLSFSRDGKQLYFSRLEFVGEFRLYSDLYRYDVVGKSAERLTVGYRAKDPDYCAGSLVYAAQKGRFSRIERYSLEDGTKRVVYSAPEYVHVSNPRCTADGEVVYFSERGRGLLDSIRAVNIRAGTLLPPNRNIGVDGEYGAIFPEPTDDGSVYFTRVRKGFYELARKNAGHATPEVLAKSTYGYWMPSIESGKMAVTLVTSRGHRAAVLDVKSLRALGETGPAVSATVKQAPAVEVQSESVQVRNYNFLKSLAPRIWSPVAEFGTDRAAFGVSLLGWDDTDQLRYAITPWYDAFVKKPMGSISTRHRISTFNLGLSAERTTTDTYELSDARRIYSHDTTFGASLSRPWRWTRFSFVPSIIGEWNRSAFGGDVVSRVFEPDHRLGLDLRLSSLKTYMYSVGPESGTSASILSRKFWSEGDSPTKAYVHGRQVVPVFPQHGALDVQVFGAAAVKSTYDIPDSIIEVGGSGDPSRLDLPLRGYPSEAFHGTRAAALQLEYRLPISQIFRGADTFPLFNRNLGAFVFYDAAKVKETDDEWKGYVAGAGGGLILNMTAFYHLPLSVKFQYAHGFHRNHLGQNMFNVLIGGGLPF